jgi:DNA-binding transcriptional regulator YiaG
MMTDEENQRIADEIIRFQEENPDYWGEQDENGVDLARLRENLKLTPAERLDKLGIALLLLREMEQARERPRSANEHP